MKKSSRAADNPDPERVFLHDLASQLMLAQGWLDRWRRRDPSLPQQAEFGKVRQQLEKINDLLASRRDHLARDEETPA